ncbi:hypothetical protein D9619_012862 [Psilocybe cf. subviscida]|uniref:Uncharacterized protein n=1 Tax=Psilocybe cf. subviscida TaxID=2480587 RepID=A0A8H5BI94_9AGAR|nr:hypothetical protein D9619_012862 [Psilocybe cf. subviscida]
MTSLLLEPLIPDFNYHAAVEAALAGCTETAHGYVPPVDDGTEQAGEDILRWSQGVLSANGNEEDAEASSCIVLTADLSGVSSASATPCTSPIKINSKRKAPASEEGKKENTSPWKIAKRAKFSGPVPVDDPTSSEYSNQDDEELESFTASTSDSEYEPSTKYQKRPNRKNSTTAPASGRANKLKAPQSQKKAATTTKKTVTDTLYSEEDGGPIHPKMEERTNEKSEEYNHDHESDPSFRAWGSDLSSAASDDSGDENEEEDEKDGHIEEHKSDTSSSCWGSDLSSVASDILSDYEEIKGVVTLSQDNGDERSGSFTLADLHGDRATSGVDCPADDSAPLTGGNSQPDLTNTSSRNETRDSDDCDDSFSQPISDITGIRDAAGEGGAEHHDSSDAVSRINASPISPYEHAFSETLETSPKNKLKKSPKSSASNVRITWGGMTPQELTSFCKRSLVNGRYVCNGFDGACVDKDYSRENVFKRHLIDKHSNTRFRCELDGCSYSASRMDLVTKHKSVHRLK